MGRVCYGVLLGLVTFLCLLAFFLAIAELKGFYECDDLLPLPLERAILVAMIGAITIVTLIAIIIAATYLMKFFVCVKFWVPPAVALGCIAIAVYLAGLSGNELRNTYENTNLRKTWKKKLKPGPCWDSIQKEYSCCGVIEASDWGSKMPDACLGNEKGCYTKLVSYYNNKTYTIIVCLLGSGVLLILAAVTKSRIFVAMNTDSNITESRQPPVNEPLPCESISCETLPVASIPSKSPICEPSPSKPPICDSIICEPSPCKSPICEPSPCKSPICDSIIREPSPCKPPICDSIIREPSPCKPPICDSIICVHTPYKSPICNHSPCQHLPCESLTYQTLPCESLTYQTLPGESLTGPSLTSSSITYDYKPIG